MTSPIRNRRPRAATPPPKKAAPPPRSPSAAAVERRNAAWKPKTAAPALLKGYTGNKSREIGQLVGGKGTSQLNKDGSQTTKATRKEGGANITQSVTTAKAFGTAKLKFESESKKSNDTISTKHGYEASRDVFGRKTSSQSRETSVKLGNTTEVNGRTTAKDVRGNTQVTTKAERSVTSGSSTSTDGRSITTGAKGTSQTVSEKKTEVKNGDVSSRTASTKLTTGSSYSATGGFEVDKEGKFQIKNGVDYKQGRSVEASAAREYKLKDPSTTAGLKGEDRAAKLQKGGDVLAAAGATKELHKKEFDGAKLKDLQGDKVSFAGSKVGVAGKDEVTLGANGFAASSNRTATAGLYAQKNDKVDGKYASASYKAGAKVEAKASYDASAKVNANGVELTAGGKVGVSAEAGVNGKLESKPLTVLGTPLTAGVEGNAKVSAELSAQANGKAAFTRKPPTAIVEGKVGASAVAKAEADVKVSAGPFAVKGSVYGSAGAEATASGVIGFDDGKLKIGGSLGAAVGLGAGGSVNVEVDVKQIGQMGAHAVKETGKAAFKAADVNNDGKLDRKDARVAAGAVGKAVSNTVHNTVAGAKQTVNNATNTVKGWFGW
jgi:hypothetical protein